MQQIDEVFEDLLLIQQGNNSYIHRRCNSYAEPNNQVIKTVFHSQILMEQDDNNIHQRECSDLLNEWRILSSLNHPYIIRAFNCTQNHKIETAGRKLQCCSLFLESAFCDLFTLCQSNESMLPFRSIVKYFKQISHALQYLHQHDIAHNDIKLENILLISRGVAKLADFGFSYKPPQELVNRWQPRTLNCYTSPEIVNFRNELHEAMGMPLQYDQFCVFSSDVYALTTSLFLAIYKRPPIYGLYPTPNDQYYQLLINDPDMFWGLEFIQQVDEQLIRENVPRTLLESLKDLLEAGLAEEYNRITIDEFLNHEFFEKCVQLEEEKN